MRGRALLIATLLLTSAPIVAQTSISTHASAADAGTASASTSCVDVSVNDRPALSYECLNQHLAAAAVAGGALLPPLDAVTHEPGNRQLGQFNFSAFSIRMGDNLGKSVVPQRPPPPASMPLLGVPPPVH